MTATQQVLDYKLLIGGRYRYADIIEATGVSRKTVYRLRKSLAFGARGIFTYGESIVMVFTCLSNMHVHDDNTRLALQALAHKIDHTPNATHVGVYRLTMTGAWYASVGDGELHMHHCAHALVANVAALALTLADAHARVHTPMREYADDTAGLAHRAMDPA